MFEIRPSSVLLNRNLAAAEAANGLTEQQLQNLVTLGGQISILRLSDLREGLESLKRSGRVFDIADLKPRRYALSETAKAEIAQVINKAEERTRVRSRSFLENVLAAKTHTGKLSSACSARCSRNSAISYVQVITSKKTTADIAEQRLLSVALEESLKFEKLPDASAFRYGVNRFFRESTPHFDLIKWNMAQNFYVAKALGIDGTSDLLSSEIFKDTVLYCDTNVLIAGLSPENRHYNSFRELAKSCSTIGMRLKATRLTLDELRGVINTQDSLLRKVIDRIPDDTRPKVRSFLLEAYLSEKEKCDSLSLDVFIDRFQKPLQTLHDSFGVSEVDDEWFDQTLDDSETKKLAIDLSQKYREMRGRPKSESARLHDALLVRYVSRENMNNHKSWVVTLDVTLADWNARKGIQGSKIITLDAFLQWMAPVMPGATEGNRLSRIFAEAIRYQLLPRDIFFQLRDFQVFAEMGIETKQLPADDVEACIREIKQAGPHLDPSKAEDREKMGLVIQRYFADPGTKHKRKIEELQTKSEKFIAGACRGKAKAR